MLYIQGKTMDFILFVYDLLTFKIIGHVKMNKFKSIFHAISSMTRHADAHNFRAADETNTMSTSKLASVPNDTDQKNSIFELT
jgi:hypothetical protein